MQAQPGPLHERKESWRTSTFHRQTGRLRADRKATKIRFCTAQEIHSLHNEGPALQESRSAQQECRLMDSGCSCCCFQRMQSIWFRERGQDLWTKSKRSRGELQLSISRPEGCADRKAAKSECAQLRKYIRCTMKVQHCNSQGVLNKNAGSGSSGCISARSCFSAAAVAFRECKESGSASAARTSGPCAI